MLNIKLGDNKDIGQQETYVLRLSHNSDDAYLVSKDGLSSFEQTAAPNTIIVQQEMDSMDEQHTYILQTESGEQTAQAAEILQQLMTIAHTSEVQEIRDVQLEQSIGEKEDL